MLHHVTPDWVCFVAFLLNLSGLSFLSLLRGVLPLSDYSIYCYHDDPLSPFNSGGPLTS